MRGRVREGRGREERERERDREWERDKERQKDVNTWNTEATLRLSTYDDRIILKVPLLVTPQCSCLQLPSMLFKSWHTFILPSLPFYYVVTLVKAWHVGKPKRQQGWMRKQERRRWKGWEITEEGGSWNPWTHLSVEDDSGPQQLMCICCFSSIPDPVDLFISVSHHSPLMTTKYL